MDNDTVTPIAGMRNVTGVERATTDVMLLDGLRATPLCGDFAVPWDAAAGPGRACSWPGTPTTRNPPPATSNTAAMTHQCDERSLGAPAGVAPAHS